MVPACGCAQGVRKAITAAAAAERPPLPPDLPKVLTAKIHCGEAERAQVQTWDLNSVQAMHAWCQERLDLVVEMGLRPKGSLVGRAGSGAHSQRYSLRTNHGLSASFSLEEGWTVVKRRKEKKGKKRRAKKGKEQKKELGKVGKSSEFSGFPQFLWIPVPLLSTCRIKA